MLLYCRLSAHVFQCALLGHHFCISYIYNYQCWNLHLHISFTQICAIFFCAVVFYFLLLQCGIFSQPRSWKIDLITERQRGGKEKQRENWLAGSIQGTELQYLSLCILLLSSVVVLIGAKLSSTQQSDPLNLTPKQQILTQHTPTHTRKQRHTAIDADRTAEVLQNKKMQWESGWHNG